MNRLNPNRWATFKEPIARWRALFPPVLEIGVERLLEFARRVLEAGEREEVYRVVQAPNPFYDGPYRAGAGLTYLEHVREVLARTKALLLFYGGGPGPTSLRQLRTPARVAYYEDNVVREEEVEDLGELIRRLRPGDIGAQGAGMRSVCPVVVDGRAWTAPLDQDNRPYPPKPVGVRIQLESDIWFPRVMGQLDWPEDLRPGSDDMYDNSVLASRHTPRLNRFIAAVREAALDLGAQWELEESEEPGLHVHYRPMCHEAGIDLHLRPVAKTLP